METNVQPPTKRQKTNQQPSAITKTAFSKSQLSTYSQKLERFSTVNSNFYSLPNLISSSSSGDTLAESKNIENVDESEIRRLEKKLGIKSGGKLTKAFKNDGLDGN
jgi:hypothetical protein